MIKKKIVPIAGIIRVYKPKHHINLEIGGKIILFKYLKYKCLINSI